MATTPAASLSVPAPTSTVTGLSAALVALYNAIPFLVSGPTGVDPSVVPALYAIARGIGSSMVPEDAVAAFAAAVDAIPDASPSPTQAKNRIDDATNRQIVARVGRMVMLAPYAEALVNVAYATRPDGVTARADCVERFEREVEVSTGNFAGVVSVALTDTRDRIVDFLSREITRLDDVVPVSANVLLPSLWWAWRLYQDPTRAPELVARNDVAHPSFMPLSFEALSAPGS